MYVFVFSNIIHSARVVCFFKYNSQALKGNHASHLCNNPNCINDKHIVPESATSNERRNECFKIGSASNCQCVPGCLFVRNGHLLPCRNNLDLSECICEENCFREGKFLGFNFCNYWCFSYSWAWTPWSYSTESTSSWARSWAIIQCQVCIDCFNF